MMIMIMIMSDPPHSDLACPEPFAPRVGSLFEHNLCKFKLRSLVHFPRLNPLEVEWGAPPGVESQKGPPRPRGRKTDPDPGALEPA